MSNTNNKQEASLAFYEATFCDLNNEWLAHKSPYTVIPLTSMKTMPFTEEELSHINNIPHKWKELFTLPGQRITIKRDEEEDLPNPIPYQGIAILTLPTGTQWYSAVYQIPTMRIKHPLKLDVQDKKELDEIFTKLFMNRPYLSYQVLPSGEKETLKALNKQDLETFRKMPEEVTLELLWQSRLHPKKGIATEGTSFAKVTLRKNAYPAPMHCQGYLPEDVKNPPLYLYSPAQVDIHPMLGLLDKMLVISRTMLEEQKQQMSTDTPMKAQTIPVQPRTECKVPPQQPNAQKWEHKNTSIWTLD